MKCKRCEKEFTPKHSRQTTYCSRECCDQASIAVCYCKTCNKRFESRHIKKYCSVECNPHKQVLDLPIRICISCNQEYKPKYKAQKYCRTQCNRYKTFTNPVGYFYVTKQWKQIRTEYIATHTLVNGIEISHKYCIECYRKQNRLNDMYAVDHIVRLRDGGTHEHSNLQSLCRHHHQSKSASEGNKERYVSHGTLKGEGGS